MRVSKVDCFLAGELVAPLSRHVVAKAPWFCPVGESRFGEYSWLRWP